MRLRIATVIGCVAPLLMTAPTLAQKVETTDVGPRYEDDAWYDVTEWFDDNDYNPTDEAIGRWDDEDFSFADNRTSEDSDSDAALVNEFYGEDYDDGFAKFYDKDEDGLFESASRFLDVDDDNLYDGYAFYHDENNDGEYDNYEYHDLSGVPDNAVRASEIAQSTAEGLSGKSKTIDGTVTETKVVKRFDRFSKFAKVKPESGDAVWVDLSHDGMTWGIYPDDELSATGPMVQRGNKSVLAATRIRIQGTERAIERRGRQYSGTVQATRKATVQGNERLVVKLKTSDDKMMTVDLGNPADAKQVQKGKEITVSGVPVNVGDRVLLIADQSRF